MLENLLDLIKQKAGAAIINNPAIPNEHNDAAIAAAGGSIVDGLKKMIAGGNTQDIVNLFNHQGGDIANTPAAQQISGGFVQTLMDKFGLGQSAAGGIASSLIPSVLQSLVSKTNDPNDSSFNIQSIIGHLTGGQSQVGGMDIQSLISKFTGGGATTNATGGGGIMDTIKGLFGK
jgi:predicted secreted protein